MTKNFSLSGDTHPLPLFGTLKKILYKLLPSDRALAKRPARQVHRDEGNRSRGGEHSGQPGGQVLTPGSRYLDQRWSIYSPQNGILLAKSYL